MKAVICGICGAVVGGYLGILFGCFSVAYIVFKNGTEEERAGFERIMRNSEEA